MGTIEMLLIFTTFGAGLFFAFVLTFFGRSSPVFGVFLAFLRYGFAAFYAVVLSSASIAKQTMPIMRWQ
jgi:hypothetical protein